MEDQDTIRFALTLHYDGSAFHGWQLQPDHPTVQGALEAVLTRLADRPRSVVGAGRTDAGVHASGQVAAVDMPSAWSPGELRRALNALLPPEVWVASVRRAPADFHPRYHATARSYAYRVGTAEEAASPFHRRWCWPLDAALDADVLARLADELPGERSFRAFAKSGQPERGFSCTVTDAAWVPWQLGFVFRITANRFLHHMVRYLVGTMVDAARGARPGGDLVRMLAGEPGLETSPPAPPAGLSLVAVEYPERAFAQHRREPTGARSASPVVRPRNPVSTEGVGAPLGQGANRGPRAMDAWSRVGATRRSSAMGHPRRKAWVEEQRRRSGCSGARADAPPRPARQQVPSRDERGSRSDRRSMPSDSGDEPLT